MKLFLKAFLLLAVIITTNNLPAYTQAPNKSTAAIEPQSSIGKGLFETDDVLNITLSGDVRSLLKDRDDNSQYHPLKLLYDGDDGSKISLSVKLKTRGHFRKLKGNCVYPPLLINFSKSDTLSSSIFNNCDKIKLVMPCRGDDYVIREWLVYKLYNLVSPKSFKTRLVKLVLDDPGNKKSKDAFYGLLLEEEKQLALRNNYIAISKKLHPTQTEASSFLTMSVFQYLIGNTDWSVQYLQNIKLIVKDSNAIPVAVPYDFDHSGMVEAPYALPTDELRMSSVRERRYRGYCVQDIKNFDDAIALYNKLKADIYALYTNSKLLDARYIKETVKYLDEFYATINNEKEVQKEFGYPCRKDGTGNVIIKGMREEKPE